MRQDTSTTLQSGKAATVGHNWQPFFRTKPLASCYEDLLKDLDIDPRLARVATSWVTTSASASFARRPYGNPQAVRGPARIARAAYAVSWPALDDLGPPDYRGSASIASLKAKPAKSWRVCGRSGGATAAVSEVEIEKVLFLTGMKPASTVSRPQRSRMPRSQSCWNAASFDPQRPCSC